MTSPCKILAALMAVVLASSAAKGDVFTWEATPVNSNWNNYLNWAGTANQFPDGISDTAIVDGITTNGIDPLLNLNVDLGTLTIRNNGDLSLGDFSMDVYGTTTVDGNGSTLDINNSPDVVDFHTYRLTIGAASGSATVTVDGDSAGLYANLQVDDTLTITDGGILDIDDGLVNVGFVGDGALDLNVGGILLGDGWIEMHGGAGENFTNNGSIHATGGTLRILSGPGSASQFDWDGAGINGASLLVSSNSTMDIDSPLSDTAFNGTITVNSSSIFDVATPWSLHGGGTTDQGVLNKNGAGVGTVAGSAVTLLNGSAVNVNSGTLVFEADLTANAGSSVNMATGTALQLDGTTTIAAAAKINPAGVWSLTVNGSAAIDQTTFNWDGSGALTNVTTVGPGAFLDIFSDHIDTGGNDQFDGTLNINSGTAGPQLLVNGNWVMNGILNMDTTAGLAHLRGNSVNVWGSVAVSGGGLAIISSPIRFENNPAVNVAAGTTLRFTHLATFASSTASFTGNGVISNRGGMETLADTTIDMPGGTVDLDGDTGLGSVNLNSDLTLNVASIEDTPGDRFDGTLTIENFAKLTVNLTNPADEWTMVGTMAITSPDLPVVAVSIGGSDFNLTGEATISGTTVWSARVDVYGTITLEADADLWLEGGSIADPNTIRGGTINSGAGAQYVRVPHNNEALVGYGTINADVFFAGWSDYGGTAELRADDGTLTLTGRIIGASDGVSVIGTNDVDGILNVTNPWETGIGRVDLVELRGGQIIGATITNTAGQTIRGHGSILSNQVHNEGTIAADGGTLTLDFTLAPNLDGSVVVGTLEVINGDLVIVDAMAADDPFNGTINVGPGRTINVMAGWTLGNLGNVGVLNVDGGADGAYVQGGLQILRGDVNVDGNGFFLAATDFDSTVNVNLPDAADILHLDADAIVRAGATFTGSGRLFNTISGSVTLAHDAQVGVRLLNAGQLEIGESVGEAQGLNFQQFEMGEWDVELDGTDVDEFDRLTLTGTASLAGELNLSLIGGFLPTLGQTFNILSATGGINGEFDSVVQPPSMPAAGLIFDVLYNPTFVQLLVKEFLPGDYNQNGVVDAADYVVWRKTSGESVPSYSGADGNGDGSIDNWDYKVWTTHFGRTAGSGAMADLTDVSGIVPEPGAWPLLLLGTAVFGRRIARRQEGNS